MTVQIPSPFGTSESEKLQERIFISTFAMLSKLASADGRISKSEALTIDKLIREVLKLETKKREFATAIFNASRNSKKSFRVYAEEYKTLLKDKPKMKEWMLDVLTRLSVSDGVLGDTERKLLFEAAGVFSISKEGFEQLLSRHLPKGDDTAYKVLGVAPGVSAEELSARYKSLLQEYDPNRLVELGLPEDFVAVAKERLQAVEAAYASLSA